MAIYATWRTAHANILEPKWPERYTFLRKGWGEQYDK